MNVLIGNIRRYKLNYNGLDTINIVRSIAYRLANCEQKSSLEFLRVFGLRFMPK